MRDLHDYAFSLVRREHRRLQWENNFWRLAEGFGYQVILGDQPLSVFGDPPVVMLNSYEFMRRANSFAGMHEIVHLLFKEHHIEQDLLDLFDGDRASATSVLERWCDKGAGVLLLPDHVVEETLDKYGNTPKSVIQLHEYAGVGAGVPLRRYVHVSDTPAAAFVASRTGCVLDVAKQYVRVPFSRGMWLPETIPLNGGHVPVSEESSVLTASLGGGRVVGVLAW